MLKRIILSLTLAVAVALVSLIPLATAADQPTAAPSELQAPVRRPAVSNVNNITQAAVKAGVMACTSRINQVANLLTAGSQGVGALLFAPPNNPDQQLISVSMEIPLKDASSAYASASFAPNQANGCAGMYETVVYWPQVCSEVAGKNLAHSKRLVR